MEATLARTQIYLTQGQHALLSQHAFSRSVPKSSLIREAIDFWAQQQVPMTRLEMLRMAKGAFTDRADMDDSVAYVQGMRRNNSGRNAMLDTAWSTP